MEVANLRNKLDFVEKEKDDALANGEKAKVEIERIKETYSNENEKRKEEWNQIETEHLERLNIMDCFDDICVFDLCTFLLRIPQLKSGTGYHLTT